MLVLIIILNALLGLSFTIGKMMLAHAAPCFTVALRMLMGGTMLTSYHAFHHRSLRLPSRRDWILCLRYALLGIFIFPILRAWGLQQVPSSKAALFFALFPLSTALAAFFMRGERLDIMQILGLIIGCIAMIPLFTSTSMQEICWSQSWNLPEIMLICSVIALSAGIVTLQHLVKDRGCPPFLTTGLSMLLGGSFALCAAYLTEPTWIHGELLIFAALVAIQTITSNIICSTLQAMLLQRYSATVMSLASFITPVSSILYGILLLQESCTWHVIASLSLLGISLAVYHASHLHAMLQKRTETAQRAVE